AGRRAPGAGQVTDGRDGSGQVATQVELAVGAVELAVGAVGPARGAERGRHRGRRGARGGGPDVAVPAPVHDLAGTRGPAALDRGQVRAVSAALARALRE